MMRALAGLLAVLCVTACGNRDGEYRDKQRERRELEARRDALRMEVGARKQLARLGTGSMAMAVMRPEDLAAAYKNVLPLEFDASTLAKEVGGRVVVEGVKDAVVNGDRVAFTLHGRGRDIRAKVNVPVFLKQTVNDLIAGVQAGLELRAEGRFAGDGNNGVKFVGRCVSARLAKNGNDNYHGMIVGAVNDRLMNRAWPVSISASRDGAPGWSFRGLFPNEGRLVILAATDQPVAPSPAPAPTPAPAPAQQPAPPAQQPAPEVAGVSTQVPAMQELVRQCSLVMEQMWLCKNQSADVLLEERARVNPQLARSLGTPDGKKRARDAVLAALDADGGGTPAQRTQKCAARLGARPPRNYVDVRSAQPCFDKPCGTRAACLRSFVASALVTEGGAWLR